MLLCCYNLFHALLAIIRQPNYECILLLCFQLVLWVNILCFQIKFLVIYTAKMSHNIWTRIGNSGHSLRPQVRRENRVRAHNWSKFFLKKHCFWPRFHIVVLGMTFFFLQPLYFFQFLFGLLLPFSIWTFISLLYLDFYFPFLFGHLFPFSIWNYFPFSIWTFISLLYLDISFSFSFNSF